MSPKVRLQRRIGVMLHMAMAFIIMILLAQLWLFTVTLDAMESREASMQVAIAALLFSLFGCGAVWGVIRLFLRAEEHQ
jgi:F0F1-type ATP synthase membrane subunit b/b'